MQDLDIQVGDRVTYITKVSKIVQRKEYCNIGIVNEKRKAIITTDLDNIEKDNILKIERIGQNGWYTVYEKDKELLTEKEREFLKQYIKFSNTVINGIKKDDSILNFMQYDEEINYISLIDDFEGLENHRLYYLKDLGLEK